jgi:hypothetical protein
MNMTCDQQIKECFAARVDPARQSKALTHA